MLEAIEKEFPQVLELYKDMFEKHIQLCEDIRNIYNELLKKLVESIDNDKDNNSNVENKKNNVVISNGSDFVKAFWKIAHDDPYSKCLLIMNMY